MQAGGGGGSGGNDAAGDAKREWKEAHRSWVMRPLLDTAHVAPPALQKIAAFHPEVVEAVRAAVAKDAVVVVGMAQNPFVKKVRKALDAAGVPFTYLEYGSYFSEWKKRLAVKLWSGWPTFPQVFVRGTLLGGQEATVAALADGSLKKQLG